MRLFAFRVLVAAAAVVSVSGTAAGAAPSTERVSVSTGGGEASGPSRAAVASADCERVAFFSSAIDLVPGDTNGVGDVFVRDRMAATTTRANVSSQGTEAHNAAGLEDPSSIAISADGRFVAFGSEAANLVPSDTNGHEDVFLHDLVTGQTSRVSVNSNGRQLPGSSNEPAISSDGRFVAFTYFAPRAFSHGHVRMRDRTAATTVRVSLGNRGRWILGDSSEPSVSSSGRWVAFRTGGDTGKFDVRVRDMARGRTRVMSVSIHGRPGNDDSYGAAISGSGRYVVFISSATNLIRHDTNHAVDVYIRDRGMETTRRVTVTPSGGQATTPGTNSPNTPAAGISSDGRYVGFSSKLVGLVAGDTDTKTDVFLRDMQTNVTTGASVAHDGTQLDRRSSDPFVCGPNVGFATVASLAVLNDTNNVRDVFLRGPLP